MNIIMFKICKGLTQWALVPLWMAKKNFTNMKILYTYGGILALCITAFNWRGLHHND